MSTIIKSFTLEQFKKINKVKTLEILVSPVQGKLFFKLPNGVTGWVSQSIDWDAGSFGVVVLADDNSEEVLVLCNLPEQKPLEVFKTL